MGLWSWQAKELTEEISLFGKHYIATRKYKYRKSKNRILHETIKTDYFTKYLPKYAGFSYKASLWTDAPPYHTVFEQKWHLSCNFYWMTKFYS